MSVLDFRQLKSKFIDSVWSVFKFINCGNVDENEKASAKNAIVRKLITVSGNFITIKSESKRNINTWESWKSQWISRLDIISLVHDLVILRKFHFMKSNIFSTNAFKHCNVCLTFFCDWRHVLCTTMYLYISNTKKNNFCRVS